MSSNCIFCEILTNQTNKFYNKILFETRNFAVIPALGSIVEGYLLIISKKHCNSIVSLSIEAISELKLLIELLSEILTEKYKPPIFFEHGDISTEEYVGSSVVHAHIHAIPEKIEIADFIDNLTEFSQYQIMNLLEIKKMVHIKKSYLFFETQTHEKHIFETRNLPSQFIRRILAEKTGNIDKWDWKETSFVENIAKTIEELEDEFP